MLLRSLALLLLLSLFIAGCPQTRQTNRYKSAQFERYAMEDLVAPGADFRPRAEVTVAAMEVPKDPPAQPVPLLATLPGETGAEMMKRLPPGNGAQSPTTAELLDLARQPLRIKEPAALVDQTKVERRFVITIAKTPDVLPGERIDWASVALDFGDKGAEVVRVSRWETAYKTVELGQVTETQKVSGGVGGSLAFDATGALRNNDGSPGVQVTAAFENSIQEQVKRSQQIEDLTPQVSADRRKLTLFRQSEIGLDVAGTFIVDVVLKLPAKEERLAQLNKTTPKLVDPLADPSQTKIEIELVDVAQADAASKFNVTGSYRFRGIDRRGARTLSEGDDNALYIEYPFVFSRAANAGYGESGNIDLFSLEEQAGLTDFYQVFVPAAGGGKKPVRLMADAGSSKRRPLAFKSEEAALAFARWLRESPAQNPYRLNDNARLFTLGDGATPAAVPLTAEEAKLAFASRPEQFPEDIAVVTTSPTGLGPIEIKQQPLFLIAD